MRLRTLPLSLAGVVCGIMMAYSDGAVTSGWCVLFLLLTTVCLQVLSNMSNELGDFLSGTDSENRLGPQYGLTEGGLTEPELRRLIRCFIVMCCIFGLAMLWAAFGTLWMVQPLALLLLGAAAIWAAMHYTLGKHPYGYHGWGDLFVFIFFGLVSVMGGYYVVMRTFSSWHVLLPGAAIGFFSVGVLNVNNIRDMITDAATRVTVPLKMGERNAKIYHTILIVLGWSCMLSYTFSCCQIATLWSWLYLLVLPLHIYHVCGVWKLSGRALDSMLPLLVVSTFLMSLLFGIGLMLS